jgi:molybdate transport system substrate-binding protein
MLPTEGSRQMLRTMLAAALLAAAPCAAQADITVFTSGGTNPGLQTLSAAWTAQTGKKVTVVGGTVTKAHDNVRDKVPGDLVVLPLPNLKDVAANLKPGPFSPVARADFGLAVKAGAPHPDISTLPKFIAVLKAGSGVGFTDPARGSAAGKMIADLLARPDFAGIKPVPTAGTPGQAIARDGVQYALGPISEEVTVPGVEVAGLMPKDVEMHFDYTGAVLAYSTQADEATAFLAYITRPEAHAVWKATGLEKLP